MSKCYTSPAKNNYEHTSIHATFPYIARLKNACKLHATYHLSAMPTLQIRELPEDLYNALKVAAEQERRSLSQQAIVTLARGLELTGSHRLRRQAVLARLSQQSDTSDTHLPADLTVYIREDRDAR
jgi:plasmid stability protein